MYYVLYTICRFQYKRIIKPSRSLCHKPVTQNHCQLIHFTVELIAHYLAIITHYTRKVRGKHANYTMQNVSSN